jgi:hypothetical protein
VCLELLSIRITEGLSDIYMPGDSIDSPQGAIKPVGDNLSSGHSLVGISLMEQKDKYIQHGSHSAAFSLDAFFWLVQ